MDVTKPLADWLRESARTGLLFGRFDEPLDDYGKRIVRAILVEIEAPSVGHEPPPEGSLSQLQEENQRLKEELIRALGGQPGGKVALPQPTKESHS